MSDTHPLREIPESDDGKPAEELFQLLYHELRRLAAPKTARESADQTPQPTALVHEAWLRLGPDKQPIWKNRAHFFSAAAEAMRRILIEKTRRRRVLEKGGMAEREEFADDIIIVAAPADEMLALHENLNRLAEEDAVAAETLGLRLRTTERIWSFALVAARSHGTMILFDQRWPGELQHTFLWRG